MRTPSPEPPAAAVAPAPRSRAQAVLLLLYLMSAAAFSMVYFRMVPENAAASRERLMAFSADRPFQYRVLVPAAARLVTEVQPASPTRELFLVLTVLIVFGAMVATAAYLGAFMPPAAAGLGGFALLYPMFWNFCLFGLLQYPSDLAAVLFFVTGLALLRRGNLAAYYVVFILATLNRETSCFLAVAFLCTHWSAGSRLRVCAHVAAQALIWLAIKAALGVLFADNPGSAFELQLVRNAHAFANPLSRGWVHVGLAFGLLWLLIPFGWRDTPLFMKRLFWVIPPFVLGMWVVANVYEVRVFAELIPILLGPALFGLRRVLREAGLA